MPRNLPVRQRELWRRDEFKIALQINPERNMKAFMRRTTRRTRFAVAAGIVAFASIAGLISTAGPAAASSGWCSVYGPVKVRVLGVTLPTGVYCFSVIGSGLHVSYTSSELDTGWIINFRERVDFYDNNGNDYYTYWGPVHNGYAYGDHTWRTGINGTARSGKVCGTLISSGTDIITICRPIYA